MAILVQAFDIYLGTAPEAYIVPEAALTPEFVKDCDIADGGCFGVNEDIHEVMHRVMHFAKCFSKCNKCYMIDLTEPVKRVVTLVS